ncbi:bifunctional riboflavin kinase/FAD synthetase, partial [Enterococcus faecium]
GKFDGVHTGHRAVIDRARVEAADGAQVVAVTFDRNPLSVLRPEKCPPDVIGPHQKLERLDRAGVDATLLLTFDETRAAQPAT